jgi:GNAT superfamily N-acetyltransferase
VGFTESIEQLTRQHNRKNFDCNVPELNNYLQKQAMQHAKSGVSRTFVLADDKNNIQAYYSLSMGSLDKSFLPQNLQKKFPHHPLPIVRLGRLAVDKNYQGQGLGKRLLVHALQKCYLLSKDIGMVAVVIDAKNQRAKDFYLQFEFDNLPEQDLTLWLPVGALRGLFEK